MCFQCFAMIEVFAIHYEKFNYFNLLSILPADAFP
jgi:hypothetical protein